MFGSTDSQMNAFVATLNELAIDADASGLWPPATVLSESYGAVVRLNFIRSSRITALQSTFPVLHYGILGLLASSILKRIRSYWSFWMRSSWGSCGPCWLGAFRLWVSFAGIWVFHSMLLWINWRRFEIWSRPPCKKMNKMLEQINNTVRGVYTITLKRSWLDAVSSY